MDGLRKLVIALGTMTESELLQARGMVSSSSADRSAKELVLKLIDLFLSTGHNAELRAQAVAGCLQAIDEIERQPKKASGGCASVLLLIAVGVGLAMWL